MLLSLGGTLTPKYCVCSLVNYAAETIQEADLEEGVGTGDRLVGEDFIEEAEVS